MKYSWYHWCFARLGGIVFGAPSRDLFVVGVTGTKGKSTVLELMNAILEASGKRTALLSSVRRKVCEESSKNLTGNTMPGRFALQRFLRDAKRAGCEYALIEVTSQGVLQYRHRFIHWDAAIFTNLAPEHIEAHGSFERYRDAKVEFFKSLAWSKKPKKYFFVNEEDPNHHYFEEAARYVPGASIVFFSRERFVREDLSSRYNLRSRESRAILNEWLLADFNLENAAAAASFARVLHIDWPTVKRALDEFRGVPGRMEFVQKTPFAVVVDYAHTPDSLEKVYTALDPRAWNPRSGGELICVLGAAGGGRDKWKRPEMGRIAAEHCDALVLTNEDPYDEDPLDILRQIEEGVLKAAEPKLKPERLFRIVDRKEAIRKAISLAKRGDVVVMTGKGSEPWMHMARGKKVPWNEREFSEEALKHKKTDPS